MTISAGDMIRVPAPFVKGKPKYMICICPKNFYYMVINSEPYLLAASAQLQVTVKEITTLDHASHIDTAKLVKMTKMDTVYVVEADKRCHKGAISPAVRKKIKDCIDAHGIMPADQVALVKANL